VIKSHTRLVHQDHVLPIRYTKTDGAGELEYRAGWLPRQVDVTVLAADPAGFGYACAELTGLVVQAPQGCADRDGRKLAARVLNRVGLAGDAAVFLGQPRVEHCRLAEKKFHRAGRGRRPLR